MPAVAGETARCKAINPGEEGYGPLHAFLGLRRVAALAAFLVWLEVAQAVAYGSSFSIC
jgi:hypothetical protein